MAKGASTLVRLSFEGNTINKYLDAMQNLRWNTYQSAKTRLSLFPVFVQDVYKVSVDELMTGIKRGQFDRYDVLARYAAYAKKNKKSDARIRDLVKTARALLEYSDFEFSDRTFRVKVRLPKLIKRARKPVTKNQIADILLGASRIELKTALMVLAATGMRPIECFSIRHRDIDFEANPPRIYVRGEFAKTGVERYVYMTSELVKQLKTYLTFKFRERRITFDDKAAGHKRMITVVGKERPNDLLFGIYHRDETFNDTKPKSLYILYVTDFNELLDSMGKGDKVNPNYDKSWREITFYTFRRYVKTAISNAGYRDFGEWLIGHAGSPYWAETEEEKAKIFHKIEPYLTFLDISKLEAQGADIASQVEEIKNQEIGSLKDVIATMSERLAALEQANKEREALNNEAEKLRAPQAIRGKRKAQNR